MGYYRQALEINRMLYPADQYPQGHPDLAGSLTNVGTVSREQGEYAVEFYTRVKTVYTNANIAG